ncbi:MAG: COG3014 family protein [Cytophagaceae bacterium]
MRRSACVLVICLLCFSCATYYQKNARFNSYFQQGQLKEAAHVLETSKKLRKKEKLLYYLNRGVLSSMKGEYAESNVFFEQAYLMVEDYQVNYLNEGAAFLSNPNMVAYRGENFEQLLINYYKALNFLKLGNIEAALVECRRMNIRLNQINSFYDSENKYKRDAFMHNLMGIIYDAAGEYNNAFIAYRNAYNIYQEDYIEMFGFGAPEQVKKDLLRTAYLNGFFTDLDFYERQFGIKYIHDSSKKGSLVFFWHNGLGPVKSEWSINFNIIRGRGGNVMFVNEQMGLSFPFAMSGDNYQSSGLSDLEFIRVAFPKYIERPLLYNSAKLSVGSKEFHLEKAQDVNAIAFRSLQDRMLLEMGKSLLRVGLKKATEYKLRSQHSGAGAAVGIFNAITEKADTRHWQTLPHNIHYTRIPLEEGVHEVTFTGSGKNSNKSEKFSFEIYSGHTHFQTFHSLEMGNDFVMP